MAEGRVKNTELSAIAAAIRSKNGESTVYKPSEMAAAIQALPGASTLGTKSIVANGSYAASGDNLDGYSSVSVNVPNSYSAEDEGKVVSNGALVAQTARSGSITQNGTYDTTNNNSITVAVSGGGGTITWSTNEPSASAGVDGDVWAVLFSEIAVAVRVSGGYNGGAVISIQFNGVEGFRATGDSPYNLSYTQTSATVDTGIGQVSIAITPPPNNTSKLGISVVGPNETRAWNISFVGENTSYGYNFSAASTLTGNGTGLKIKTIYIKSGGAWITEGDPAPQS